MRIRLTVNRRDLDLDLDPRRTLADVLRGDGVPHGCADGTCGACTVLVDGTATRSCLMLAAQGAGAHVRTVEGLPAGHPAWTVVRAAGGTDCETCLPGLVTLAAEAVAHDPGLVAQPERARRVLAANVCRCPSPAGPLPSAR